MSTTMHTDATAATSARPQRRRGRTPDALLAERERSLLDEAKALFIRYGYHQVSIATIAATVRVATKTIYVKFGNKRGLLRAIIERDLRTWQEQIDAIERSGTDVREQLDALACLMLRRMLSTPDARLRADAAAARDDELAGLVATADAPFRRSLVRMLARLPACRQHAVRDMDVLADMVIGCLLGRHIGAVASGVAHDADPDLLRRMARRAVAAFLGWCAAEAEGNS